MSWDSDDVVPFREPLAPGSKLQNGLYRIGRLLGEGSFSLTYEASQRPGRLPIAIKEFFPKGCWRENFKVVPGPPYDEGEFSRSAGAFLQEGGILERFHHPGIVRVLGMFRANRTAYLVEELLEGITLGEHLRDCSRMPLENVLEVIRQIGEALLEVHAAGLVHSDLKPDNLFQAEQGRRFVILDFGTARSYRPDEPDRQAVAAVSPGYSPLEQYQTTQRLTPAADVYALGATVYHMLQGYPPPDSRDRARGAHLIPLTDTAARVESAVMEALQLHPLRRTPGIGPFLEQLGIQAQRGPASWVQRFQPLGERTAHLGATTALALHAPTATLYTGGRDGRWCAFSWPDLKPKLSEQAHLRSPIRALTVSPDGRFLVSGAQDGSVKLWLAHERGEPHWLVSAGPPVRALQFHPQAGFVVAGFGDGTCRLLGPGQSGSPWQAHLGALQALAIHPKGTLLATGGEDQKINLWDLTAQCAPVGTIEAPGGLHSLRFNSDGSGLLGGSGENAVKLWDVEGLREARSLYGHRSEVWDAGFASDPNLLLTISADHYLYAYRADSGRMLMCSQVSQGLSGGLAIDPKYRLVATGGADGHVRAWEF